MNLPGGKSETWDLKFREVIEEVADLVLEILDREQAHGVVIASPGFIKDMVSKAIIKKRKNIKIFTDTVSIGGFAGVMELLRRDSMKHVMKHLSVIEAEEILAQFHKLLVHNPNKTAYGIDSVEVAAKAGAIETLLVLDTFLREKPEVRSRIEKIISDTDSKGGKVRIVSSEAPAGQKLKMLGGLIAILRY